MALARIVAVAFLLSFLAMVAWSQRERSDPHTAESVHDSDVSGESSEDGGADD